MLIFPLKKQWYEKIKNGEKTIEYREFKDYWNIRLRKVIQELNLCGNPKCCFQLGYKPETRIEAFITEIEIINGQNTDLKTSSDVYAIHFKLMELK